MQVKNTVPMRGCWDLVQLAQISSTCHGALSLFHGFADEQCRIQGWTRTVVVEGGADPRVTDEVSSHKLRTPDRVGRRRAMAAWQAEQARLPNAYDHGVARANQRTVLGLHNTWHQQNPDLHGALSVAHIRDQSTRPASEASEGMYRMTLASLLPGTAHEDRTLARLVLTDEFHSVVHWLVHSPARRHYTPANPCVRHADCCTVMVERAPHKPFGRPIVKKVVHPGDLHPGIGRAPDGKGLAIPMRALCRDACPHLLPPELRVSTLSCWRCDPTQSVQLGHTTRRRAEGRKTRGNVGARKASKTGPTLPRGTRRKPKASTSSAPIRINSIFPSNHDWHPATTTYAQLASRPVSYALQLPTRVQSDQPKKRRRTSHMCVRHLSLLLGDSAPRALDCAVARSRLTVTDWDRVLDVTLSLWDRFCTLSSKTMRAMSYLFDVHCIIVLYHCVHGVYVLRPGAPDGQSVLVPGASTGADDRGEQTVYVCSEQPTVAPTASLARAVEVVPRIPLLSGCLPLAVHLSSFDRSLATIGETDALFHRMLAQTKGQAFSRVHREVGLDLWGLSHHTVVM
jgi:hypothetical protein